MVMMIVMKVIAMVMMTLNKLAINRSYLTIKQMILLCLNLIISDLISV